jgi:hypothetical protein
MLKVLFTVFPSPSSTLIYQGEGVSVILTQRERSPSLMVDSLRFGGTWRRRAFAGVSHANRMVGIRTVMRFKVFKE